MTVGILFASLIAILLLIVYYYYHNQDRFPRLACIGKLFFGSFIHRVIVWELLVLFFFIEGYLVLFAPDLLLSNIAILYWMIYTLFFIIIALSIRVGFRRTPQTELVPGDYLIKVTEEKSSAELVQFFTKLIQGFENQYEKANYEEYIAARNNFLIRDDAIGRQFREIYMQITGNKIADL